MVSTIYIVRHGLRANDLPSPTGIDGDVRCSVQGEQQILELAAFVPSLSPKPQKIYSSPFYRCLQTITPSAAALGLGINVEPGFGEYYHYDRPTHPVPLPATQSAHTFPLIDQSYEPRVQVSRRGEDKDKLHGRVAETLNAMVEASTSVEAVIVCTHAATKIAIGHNLANVEVRSGTCSMDRYDLVEGEWKCTTNGDTSFLRLGEQMHWDFSMAVEAGSVQDEQMRKRAQGNTFSKTAVGTGAPEDVDMTTILVPLDLSGQQSLQKESATLQVADLDKVAPLIQFDDIVYQGSWQKTVGTEVFTTPDGEYVGQTRDRLVLSAITHEPLERIRLPTRLREIDAQKEAEDQAQENEGQNQEIQSKESQSQENQGQVNQGQVNQGQENLNQEYLNQESSNQTQENQAQKDQESEDVPMEE